MYTSELYFYHINYVQVIQNDITMALTDCFSFIRAAFNTLALQLPQSLSSVHLNVLTTRATNHLGGPLVAIAADGEADAVVVIAAHHLVLFTQDGAIRHIDKEVVAEELACLTRAQLVLDKDA